MGTQAAERSQINSFRAGSRTNQSLKSPSADSPEVQGGAGILGCSEIATEFSILHNSFPIKSSKIPQLLYLLHMRICRISSFVCFHQELVWKESKERFCREVPNRAALKQLKPNQTQWAFGSFCWESSVVLRGTQSSWQIQCQVHMQGAARLQLPIPVSMQVQDQQAGNTIPWPQCPQQGHPEPGPTRTQ